MKEVSNTMPMVSKCEATQCAYNLENGCHAKGITIGDGSNPGCDTFFQNKEHARENKRVAGVGACKVSSCKFNSDFECAAESIDVGYNKNKINCLTYKKSM